eukprot:31083-Pelagococcus_subviridis.AAC.7
MCRPPRTAAPVQIACPAIPPRVTPYGSDDAARPIVAICDRSPHSATNVMKNVWRKIGESNPPNVSVFFHPRSAPLSFPVVSSPSSSSTSRSSSACPPPSHAMVESYSDLAPKKRNNATAT